MENKQAERKFTIREKIAVRGIALLLAIVKPSEYTHDWDKYLEELKKLVDEN